jgi:hypothetical protein
VVIEKDEWWPVWCDYDKDLEKASPEAIIEMTDEERAEWKAAVAEFDRWQDIVSKRLNGALGR